jgi:hypothetical protein
MINSKKVLKRFEDNPELTFSNDKSIAAIAETICDWLNDTQSEAKTVERILIHQTLNDYEKAAGIFFLGALISTRLIAATSTIGGLEEFIEAMKGGRYVS